MKSVLIVEDEKAIRAGIKAIVSNAPLEIENVIECQNGIEAMTILEKQYIDVMITDIKMPKMDGIELINQASKLPSPPIVVVISGYNDFDYAVDVFKSGVKDYLLKPIEREKVHELLCNIQNELDEKKTDEEHRRLICNQLLRSIMLGLSSEDDIFDCSDILLSHSSIFFGNYYLVCLAPDSHIEQSIYHVCHNVNGHMILIVSEDDLFMLKQSLPKSICAGISSMKSGLVALKDAYLEAEIARKIAFIKSGLREFSQVNEQKNVSDTIPINALQISSMLFAGKGNEAIDSLGKILFATQNDSINADEYIVLLDQLTAQLLNNFSSIEFENKNLESLSNYMNFQSAYEYHITLCDFIIKLVELYPYNKEIQSKERMRSALEYVNQHFRKQINMAVVSNHISMNYTQFSSLFKANTGSTFSDYLKRLRLNESKKLLEESKQSIRSIALLSGFKNEKHFMKCFKQEFGVSPGDYRRSREWCN
ncbi:MAG: response regulator [Oscillospiraceae bacterium]|nr:response regulator [Oscillospiraceae bacterium]